MDKIFFDTWESTFRTAFLTVFGYVSMILLLRASGKRTLSKMNAFDFVVTIALGSSLASISLNKNVTLTDGIVAFSLLIFLQYALAWLSVRSKKVRSVITGSPALLFYRGEFLHQAMKSHRVTPEEMLKAGRQKGISNLQDVELIILETTGELTILEKNVPGDLNTAEHIRRKSG